MSAREQHLAQTLSGRQGGLKSGGIAAVLFRPRTLIALLLIGLFSFAALIVLSGFAGDLRKSPPGQATPRSVSAVGYKALIDLMDDSGYYVEETRGEREIWTRQNQLVIYTPSSPMNRLNETLEDSADSEPKLIILPKWEVSQMNPRPDETGKTGWARKDRYNDGLVWSWSFDRMDIVPVVRQLDDPTPLAKITFNNSNNPVAATELDFRHLQYFDLGTDWEAYQEERRAIRAAERAAARAERGETEDDEPDETNEVEAPEEIDASEDSEELSEPVRNYDVVMTIDDKPVLIRETDTNTFLLSEPDLVNTMALDTRTGARMALAVIDEVSVAAGAEQYGIDFDVSLHGLRDSRNIIKLMLQPPFLAATLCLLAAGGLVAWQGFNRFGDPQRDRPDYAQGPVSLAKTAANFMEIAGRTHRTGEAYAGLVKRQVADSLGFAGRPEAQTDILIETREKHRDITPSFAEITASIKSATPHSYAQYSAALARWRAAMTDIPTHEKDPTL